jgi:hypothetical protein
VGLCRDFFRHGPVSNGISTDFRWIAEENVPQIPIGHRTMPKKIRA